jgi:DNA topoisomerase-1
VRDRATLDRIRSLAIPPAWESVWICPRGDGHLQATGRDARGRKQYRYHPQWREVRDETKYGRMAAFGRALPRIRRRVTRDLALPGLPREKILATLVRLLESTLIRVGNEEYARDNSSFGLTTLRTRQVAVDGAKIRFNFRGKSGVEHAIELHDRRMAGIVKRIRELPGQELFQYLDEAGERRSVESADVNAYIRDAAGGEFTSKDFRTWAGTLLAAKALREAGAFGSKAEAMRNVNSAIESVAKLLGNTKAVCRKCYVHPNVVDAYLEGRLQDTAAGEAAVIALLTKPRSSLAALLKRSISGSRPSRRRSGAPFPGALRSRARTSPPPP